MVDIKTKIVNVIVSIIFNHRLDLDEIAKLSEDEFTVDLGLEDFPGAMIKLKEPKTTLMAFESGKIVCTGSKSEKEAKRAAEKIVRIFRDSGIKILGEPGIKIQSVTASAVLGSKINLDRISMKFKYTRYDPEEFSGLVYRMRDPKASILLFESGRIIITGVKTEQDVLEVVQNIYDLIEENECWLKS